MAEIKNLDIAKGVFNNIPYVDKVWVKDGEYHINKPNSNDWELFDKNTLDTKTTKKVK
jgi:hypothetical protein